MGKEGKYTCGICKIYKTNTIRGLGIHLSKGHLIKDTEEYYNNMKMGYKVTCFFCGNIGKYINLSIGYRNLCESKECLSKVYATYSIDSIMFSNNCSEEEAKKILEEKQIRTGNSGKETIKKRLKENPNYLKEKSHNSKEYWIKRGYSEEESLTKTEDVMKNLHKKFSDKRKDNYDYYKDSYTTNIEYWIKKGFSEKDAIDKLSERQTTFSKEICISKYGEEEGLKVWGERQNKWINTLDMKSDDEKFEINKKKVPKTRNGGTLSNISMMLFDNLSQKINKDFLYGVHEYNINTKEKRYYYDFTDLIDKRIIEFNGDYWHCNPTKYNEDFIHMTQQTAKEIWQKDIAKIKIANDNGFEVLTIWESEFNNDREGTINKCLEFLNKNNVI